MPQSRVGRGLSADCGLVVEMTGLLPEPCRTRLAPGLGLDQRSQVRVIDIQKRNGPAVIGIESRGKMSGRRARRPEGQRLARPAGCPEYNLQPNPLRAGVAGQGQSCSTGLSFISGAGRGVLFISNMVTRSLPNTARSFSSATISRLF